MGRSLPQADKMQDDADVLVLRFSAFSSEEWTCVRFWTSIRGNTSPDILHIHCSFCCVISLCAKESEMYQDPGRHSHAAAMVVS